MGTLSSWLLNLIRGGMPAGGAKHAAVDPVCGMRVDPGKAKVSYTYHGKTYQFCTHRCEATFRSDPGKYAR